MTETGLPHGSNQRRTTRWAKRLEFAEVAEALGVNTDMVMAAEQVTTGPIVRYTILYTPDRERPTELWMAQLHRDSGRVLRLTGVPQPRPGLFEQIAREAEGRIERVVADAEARLNTPEPEEG